MCFKMASIRSIRSGIGESMNDRYLFKAKDCNSIWRAGLLIALQEGRCAIEEKDGSKWACDSETLCQCTGLKDKNGKLIWENDIVKFDVYYYEKLQSSIISQIKWCNALCALSLVVNGRGTRGTLGHLMDLNKEIEVIGNIFDNPELVKSEK